MRNYIGLACTFHDPAIAIVDQHGEVVFAEATERYLQFKRGFQCVVDGYPRIADLIEDYCDPKADLTLSRSWSYWHYMHMRFDTWMNRVFGWIHPKRKWTNIHFWRDTYRGAAQAACTGAAGIGARYVAECFEPARKVVRRDWNHHLCHAAAACFSSPYTEAVCAVIDGFGEYTSTQYYRYKDGKLKKLPVRQQSWNSLGLFYELLCRACGFDGDKGEEWKVMGLAPTGKFDQKAYDILKKTLTVDGLRLVGLPDMYKCPLWREKRGVVATAGFDPADLAFTGQQLYEEWTTQLLQNLYKLGGSDNLVLSGGCGLNSAYNGMITEQTGFKNTFVYCAPADDGNAVGAALLSYQRDNPNWKPKPETRTPYLGSTVGGEALSNLIKFDRSGCITEHKGTIHEVAADLLVEGQIIGWVQGRAEFGPRALGNRSILADARDPDIKDRINGRVKFREEFRPFAPSILHEYGEEFFENYQETPYMERTLRWREEVAHLVPGVVHNNRTGRLQSVKREWNERYYDLIEAFRKRTGVPLLLNTSFNVMGKPIVHGVEDAIAVLHTTGLDAVVIGDYLIRKPVAAQLKPEGSGAAHANGNGHLKSERVRG